jgi:hypothetical protein
MSLEALRHTIVDNASRAKLLCAHLNLGEAQYQRRSTNSGITFS